MTGILKAQILSDWHLAHHKLGGSPFKPCNTNCAHSSLISYLHNPASSISQASPTSIHSVWRQSKDGCIDPLNSKRLTGESHRMTINYWLIRYKRYFSLHGSLDWCVLIPVIWVFRLWIWDFIHFMHGNLVWIIRIRRIFSCGFLWP